MKYLIAGTGGVGGSIAAFLSLAGKDVTCIARGEHLTAIREHGLRLHSDLKGEHTLPVKAYTAEEYNGSADVIFVCVKGYSVDSITDLIKRVSHKDTIVIPILNVYGTGPRIQRLVPGVTVLDGCIYIVGFVSGKGEITQMGKIFRLVYGAHKGTVVPRGTLEAVRQDLEESGIKAEISPDINRDTFVKWSFISAMAVTGAYYDVPMGEVQKPGKVRDTFIGLSEESAALGRKLIVCPSPIKGRVLPRASIQQSFMEACEVALPAMLPRTVVSLSALTDRTAWLLQECSEALPDTWPQMPPT